jgi:hypothetical protein
MTPSGIEPATYGGVAATTMYLTDYFNNYNFSKLKKYAP